MRTLKVEITEFIDVSQWTWRLLDEKGAFLADHRVELDRQANEYRGYSALYDFVYWNAEPDLESTPTQAPVERVGRWIRDEAWGPIAAAILKAAASEPVVVLVEVPDEASALLFRPFELAFVSDSTPAARDVSLVFDTGKQANGSQPKAAVGTPLRMLALFSTPTDQSVLNTRHERYELRRLIDRVAKAAGRSIELRILQYGVTRELLEDVLDEGEGWDLIHFSGHGLPAGLVLEQQDGSTDLVPSSEFAELLRPARDQLKLVFLSSCESGATTAAQTMQMLSIEDTDEALGGSRRAGLDEESGALPAVAQSLSAQLACAVLAMRYPVEDEFAVNLSADLYEGLLGHGQTLPRALQRALSKAAGSDRDLGGASLATPALFGSAAVGLKLDAHPGEPATFALTSPKLAYFEPEPEHFVGRVGQLARASAALAPKSSYQAVIFHGMAGAGKTACALELAYRHEEHRFEAMAWHRAPSEGHDIDGALAQFALDLETQFDGLELAHAVDDAEKLRRFLPRLRQLLAERSLLIALDNVESLLTDDGAWRDERWRDLIEALISHGGLSRLVITTRVLPTDLSARPNVLVESINSLSAAESALLARRLPNLGQLISNDAEIGQPTGRNLVRRTLEIVQGNPKLIELADRQAADAASLEARIGEADETWAARKDLGAFFKTGQPDQEIEATDFLQILFKWTDSIASTLSPDVRLAFQLLCSIEPEDRHLLVAGQAWPVVWNNLNRPGDPPDFSAALAAISERGLIDVVERDDNEHCQIHPAVEQAERDLVDDKVRETIDRAMASFWVTISQDGDENTSVATFAGLAAAPYLLRLGQAGLTIHFLGRAVSVDPSPNTIATALPLLHRALALSDEPLVQRQARTGILLARSSQRYGDVVAEIKELIEISHEEKDFGGVAVLRNHLFNELIRTSRLKEAHEMIETPLDPEVEAGMGELSLIADDVCRLQVRQELGENRDVLGQIQALLDRVDKAPASEDGEVAIEHWNVREAVLSTGRSAAQALKEWKLALEFNDAIRKSEQTREAPEIEQAKTEFNDHAALIELGHLDEAEKMLRRVRLVAERMGDLHLLGTVLGACAAIERRRGNLRGAIAFDLKALRVDYAFGEPAWVTVSHHNLASHLAMANSPSEEFLAHKLAGTLISFQIGSGQYSRSLEGLAHMLVQGGPEGIPSSFDVLCERLDRIAEVDFRKLFSGLPLNSPDGETALAAVLSDALRFLAESKEAFDKAQKESQEEESQED